MLLSQVTYLHFNGGLQEIMPELKVVINVEISPVLRSSKGDIFGKGTFSTLYITPPARRGKSMSLPLRGLQFIKLGNYNG